MSNSTISINSIALDGGTQSRAQIDQATVESYASDMEGGAAFPPVTVFHDGETYWLADGFHRVRAALYLGVYEIEAEIKQGDKRAAILHSLGANSQHGLRRTNADKRRSVMVMLEDEEWRQKSDREIARCCCVSHDFVNRTRKADLSSNDRCEPPTRTVTRGGTTYQQDTTNIGKGTQDFDRPVPIKKECLPNPAPHVDPMDIMRVNISLTKWNEITEEEQGQLLEPTSDRGSNFNRQSGNAIEWAQWSWNPVTGCLHNCTYCYARDIANQTKMAPYYPNGFEPSFRSNSLNSPAMTAVPDGAEQDTRLRNVFTCSMADLFGKWVPQQWIDAVFKSISSNPQWNFLMLTKFPQRLSGLNIPSNAWMGTSVDSQSRVAGAEKYFADVDCGVRWLSVEPMIEKLTFNDIGVFDWVVIGGASASSNTPAWCPPYRWVEHLVGQCDKAGVPVYFKSNLGFKNRVLELPFDAPIVHDPQEAPRSFFPGGK
jgi:protein gp37